MDFKQFARVEIKDADKGEVAAVFSTFDVIDHDGDVTIKGAFIDGQPTRISAYGHTSHRGILPVGKGAIRELKTEAVLEGQFFLNTAHGRDTFETVKQMGDLQEWSYGYDVTKHSFGEFDGKQVRFLEGLKVNEVSPVLLGAGINTRTLTAKHKFSEHASSVLADVKALLDRATDVIAFRASQGKTGLSDESTDVLVDIDGDLKRLRELLEGPSPDTSCDDLQREFARFIAITQGV